MILASFYLLFPHEISIERPLTILSTAPFNELCRFDVSSRGLSGTLSPDYGGAIAHRQGQGFGK